MENLKITLFFAAGDVGGVNVPPQGHSYIASYMEDKGPFIFQGLKCDARYTPALEVTAKLHLFKPDAVFMTVGPSNLWNSAYWTHEIKTMMPNVFIAWGGFLPTFIPEEILGKYPFVDAVSRFDGEESCLALGRALLNGQRDFSEVPNLSWRKSGKIINNPLVPPTDLSQLTHFNVDLYSNDIRKETAVHLALSRGCPYRCGAKICSGYWGGGFSIVSADFFRQLMADLKKYRGLKKVHFTDHLSRPGVLELFEDVLPQFPDYKYHGRSGVEGLDEDKVRRIAKLGFQYIALYSSPLAPSAMKRRCKEISMAGLPEVLGWFRKYDIAFTVGVHIGTADETMEELRYTMETIDDLDLEKDQLEITFGTYVQPGSVDYERLLEQYPGFKYLKPERLGDNYLYQNNEYGRAYAVYDFSAKYQYRDIFDLKTLPISVFSTYIPSESLPFDFKTLVQVANTYHIGQEMPDQGLALKGQQKYIAYLDAVRKSFGGRLGCLEKTGQLLEILNAYFLLNGRQFDFLTAPFYFERTLRGLDLSRLPSFGRKFVLGEDKPDSTTASWLIVHLNPESMGYAESWLKHYSGRVLDLISIYKNPQLINSPPEIMIERMTVNAA